MQTRRFPPFLEVVFAFADVPRREEVVDNVEGAQRELLKYWSRVSGNRWLIAKMFGVLVS